MTYPHEGTHPLSYLGHGGPDALARDKRLTIGHRRMILRRWLHDVQSRLDEAQGRPEDRSLVASRDIGLLARINGALRHLGDRP